MKVNFNSVSFKANLLISNRADNKRLYELTPYLQDSFSQMTPNDNNTMILSTTIGKREDTFKAYDKKGKNLAEHEIVFSKGLDESDQETLTQRLVNIYKLLMIKATYNKIIEDLKDSRAKLFARISELSDDTSISEKERNRQIDYNSLYIKYLNQGIEHHQVACRIDCDSFELSHHLKSEYE